MRIVYDVILFIAVIVAVVFSLLVYATGKGDAMSGSSSVRTTYKGKESFDDTLAKILLYMGVGFMGLMIVLDIIGNRLGRQ